jgi:hypothetical protein
VSFLARKKYIEQHTIEPWNTFRQKSMQLNEIHNDCVNQFARAMGNLLTGSDGEPAFQGPSADTLATMVEHFLDAECKLSGTSDDPAAQVGLQPDLAAACEKWAKQLEQKLGDIATQPVILENAAMGVTVVVGTGAVAQGGLDVPWDLFALLLGLGVVATFQVSPIDVHDGFRIKTQEEVADEVRTKAAEQAENDDVSSFDSDATNVQNNNPLPKLPPNPQEDPKAFLKVMGLAAGVAGLIAAGATIIWNLTSDQQDMAQRIKQDFGTVSIDDIREIIANNPGLTEAQYRLLVEYFRRTGRKPYDVLSVVGIGTRKDGGPARITFVTQGDIDHIRKQHPNDFSSLSDQQLADVLTQTMEGKPDGTSSDGTSTRYEFDNMNINGKKVTIAIVVSDEYPGRIVTSFIMP